MARSPNCTGAPLYKGRVDVTITYPDPYEPPLLDPAEALPTSEPATAQIEITITQAMLPVWSPYELPHQKAALLYAGGKNTAGASRSIYYRVLKNGTSVATGSGSVSAGNQYGWSHYRFPDVAVDDVLACKLWASGAGCDWDYKAAAVVPTRIGPADTAVLDVLILAPNKYPATLTGWNAYTGFALYLYHDDVRWEYEIGTIRHSLMLPRAQYRLMRAMIGDESLYSYCDTRVNNRGTYYSNIVPSRISYTPLNLRV